MEDRPEMLTRIVKRLGDMRFTQAFFTLRDMLIYSLHSANGPATADQRQIYEREVDRWLADAARAALEEIREPTVEMVKAAQKMESIAQNTISPGSPHSPANEWRTMVDAALGYR